MKFTKSSAGCPPKASERIESLSTKEGVKYRTANLSVTSLRTPIVSLSHLSKDSDCSAWDSTEAIQSQQLGWLNPLTFVSGSPCDVSK